MMDFFTLPILDYQRRRLSFGEEHHGNVNCSCLSIHRLGFILVLSYDINERQRQFALGPGARKLKNGFSM